MVNLHSGREVFGIGPHIARQAQQRHGAVVKAPKGLRGDQALGVVEGIQPANQRLALARVVLHAEQLHAGGAGRAQKGFDLVLVQAQAQRAGGPAQGRVLGQNAVVARRFAQLLEVARAQHAGVFVDLAPLGVHRPLADFMGDDGNGRLAVAIFVVPVGAVGQRLAHGADARVVVGGRVIVVGGHGSGRRGGVQPARVFGLRGANPLAQHRKIRMAQFIADGEQHEGRVIAVGVDHALDFGAHKLRAAVVVRPQPPGPAAGVHFRPIFVLDRHPPVQPHAGLGLNVNTDFIGSLKGGPRRTPGMKTHVI